jgi:hypothetical protein
MSSRIGTHRATTCVDSRRASLFRDGADQFADHLTLHAWSGSDLKEIVEPFRDDDQADMFGIADDLGPGTGVARTTPTADADPPICSTANASATGTMRSPRTDTDCAVNSSRKENLLVAGSCSTGPERRSRVLAPVPGSNGSRE